jgi:hypothetical protein
VETSFRLWTAEASDLAKTEVFIVIHFSTGPLVHSFTTVDQPVCLKHPQAYPQDASLAPTGAGVIGACSHAGPGLPHSGQPARHRCRHSYRPGQQPSAHAPRLSDEVSDNRHGQRWTSADTCGRSAAGHAFCGAGSPCLYSASGRRGRRFKSGHPDQENPSSER